VSLLFSKDVKKAYMVYQSAITKTRHRTVGSSVSLRGNLLFGNAETETTSISMLGLLNSVRPPDRPDCSSDVLYELKGIAKGSLRTFKIIFFGFVSLLPITAVSRPAAGFLFVAVVVPFVIRSLYRNLTDPPMQDPKSDAKWELHGKQFEEYLKKWICLSCGMTFLVEKDD